MTVTLILAMDKNGLIGRDGKLPWRCPTDLKRFKRLTLWKPVIMGRATWESLGKALPDRRNMVLTSRKDYRAEGAEVFHSMSEALLACNKDEEVMVIGGSSVYAKALPLADRMLLTVVDGVFLGDTWVNLSFPMEGWTTAEVVRVEAGPHDTVAHTFFDLRRAPSHSA